MQNDILIQKTGKNLIAMDGNSSVQPWMAVSTEQSFWKRPYGHSIKILVFRGAHQ